jgi:hypothetical protein
MSKESNVFKKEKGELAGDISTWGRVQIPAASQQTGIFFSVNGVN